MDIMHWICAGRKKILSIAIFCISTNALASSLETTLVSVNVNRVQKQVFIRAKIPPANQDKIPCHTDNNWNYSFLIETEADKAMLSLLMTAYSINRPISLVGTNDCPLSGYTHVEQLKWATLHD